MGKKWKIAAILLCVLLLFGCMDTANNHRKRSTKPRWSEAFEQIEISDEEPENTPTPENTQTENIIPENDLDPPEEDPTPPPEEHSALYDPRYTTEQIWQYFQEVALTMEYSDGDGNVTLVQKWKDPIVYRVYGTPTQEDSTYLYALLDQANEIPGFPGFAPAQDGQEESLSIYFVDYDGFYDLFYDAIRGESAYGAVQFWYYTDSNEIYSANIGYRTDIDQESRNSVILEEIVNTLGISDTVLREDSIVYQYSNSNTALSDVDWIILKILYNPAISCGMNADECRAVVESLYY